MQRSPFTLLLSSALALFALSAATVHADTDRSIDDILKPLQLTERVHYFYGSIEGRSPLNQGLNNNVGFVITDTGVVMLDSGPSARVAERIAQAVAGVTDLPVTHVISLGSQDHRWLGNGWFRDRGAEIVALRRTAQTQQEFGQSHLQRLVQTLGDETMAGTEPVSAAEPIDADTYRLNVGGVTFELLFVANAHFPGDILVHLPDENVVFTGDVVYTERMLGIHPFSDPVGNLESFRRLEALNPAIVVPGHGAATDLATARRDTGDYLQVLLREVRSGIETWETLDETVDRLADLAEFRHLRHYDDWHRANVNRTYLFLEAQ